MTLPLSDTVEPTLILRFAPVAVLSCRGVYRGFPHICCRGSHFKDVLEHRLESQITFYTAHDIR